MQNSLRVLFVEDSENDVKLLLLELRHGGWEITHERVDTAPAMKAALDAHAWNLIIADYSMPCFSGPAALAMARDRAVDVPFILVSGKVGEEMAVAAMKAGADDYLFKGDLKRLVPVVERELRDAEEKRNARRLEGQLHTRDAQLKDAQRMAHLGTWHADLRSGALVCSEEACRILGTNPSGPGLTFEQFSACLHPEDRKKVLACLHETDATRFEQDCRLECSQTTAQFVHIRGEIVRDDRGVAYEAAGMIQDITERHLIDLQLQQAKDAAEAASKAKSGFLANMSHEIRTPMTAIIGFSDMMLQPDQNASDRAECVRTIRRNAAHLLELINDILDLSKIEAGHMSVERIRCDIPQLLADLISLMRPRATEKGLEFDVSFQGPIPAAIETDPTRLRQILVNLLGNAIKFTATGSVKMVISAKSADAQNILQVDVTDSGIGLAPERIKKLFRPFTQAEESTTRKFGGTGLGLTISQQLAQLLGGQISVQSQSGVGSTFSLRVNAGSLSGVNMLTNLQEASLPVATASANWQSIPLKGRILLAEDGKDNQRLLSTHLRSAGAEVTVAENGKMAVELASGTSFDLILMDMQMPVMDGYTATAALRKKGIGIPIIALTAYAMAEDRKKCMASGCTDYLSKPIDRDVFLKTVARYIGAVPVAAADPVHPQPAEHTTSSSSSSSSSSEKITSNLINHPGMKEIIVEFVNGLPEEVRKMNQCLERSDLSALKRIVHQLRGASGGYGFDEVTKPATQAEESIKAEKSLEIIKQEVDSLIGVIRKIEGFNEGILDPKATLSRGAA